MKKFGLKNIVTNDLNQDEFTLLFSLTNNQTCYDNEYLTFDEIFNHKPIFNKMKNPKKYYTFQKNKEFIDQQIKDEINFYDKTIYNKIVFYEANMSKLSKWKI